MAKRCKRTLRLLAAVWVVGLTGCRLAPPPETPAGGVSLTPADRILVLAPHPDDEVLGCGGILQEAVAKRLPIRVVFLTYGDNNEWSFLVYRKHPVLSPSGVKKMGLVRHDEAVRAAGLLGVGPESLVFLGYPDFGTLRIWERHWGDRPPFHSMLSRATAVPYPNALRPWAPYHGEEILHDLERILRDFQPTKVFVSHPGDHNPDHLAAYLFLRVALWDVAPTPPPALYPYLIHFKRWPLPRGFRPTRALEPPALFKDNIPWISHPLPAEAVQRNARAIRAHRTQYRSSGRYLLSFIRANELFGDFPVVSLQGETREVTLLFKSGNPKAAEMEEELSEVERAAFVGFETRAAQLDGDALKLSITFSRPLGEAVQASVYAFGYRADRPFAQMPKLHVAIGALGYAVYDQDRVLPDAAIQFTRKPSGLTVRIPLDVLGRPQKLLTSARTSLGELPLDWVSWRVLELPSDVLQ